MYEALQQWYRPQDHITKHLQKIYQNNSQHLMESFQMILNNLHYGMRIKYIFGTALLIYGGVILKMIPILMMYGNLEVKEL